MATGSLVALKCLGQLDGPRFLDGRTHDGTVGLAPSTDAPFSGTRWQVIDNGQGVVFLKCLGDLDGPRFLDGRTHDGTVGLVHSTDFPFTGTHWDVLPDTVTLDSGSITSDLTIGGFARLVMSRRGDFTFSGHMHNSGALGIDYLLTMVALTPSGIAYTVQHKGHTAGTFTTGSRDDDWTLPNPGPGFNQRIHDEWAEASQAKLSWRLHANDTLTGQIAEALEEALKEAIKAAGLAAIKAAVGLL
jgi:hypothetical protein